MNPARLGVLVGVVLALIEAADQRPAHAGTITAPVSLDGSALSGTFEFVFTDASGTTDANNTLHSAISCSGSEDTRVPFIGKLG